MAIITSAATAVFFVCWDKHGPYYDGIDWIDQLTYPWVLIFLAGCWLLGRVR